MILRRRRDQSNKILPKRSVGTLALGNKFFFKKKWAIPGLFFLYFSSFQYTVDSKQMFNI